MSLDAEHGSQADICAAKRFDERVYGSYRSHEQLYSSTVSDCKGSISERTVVTGATIIPLMAKKATIKADDAPAPFEMTPPDVGAIFGRLQLLADTHKVSLTKAAELLGIPSNRLFNHKSAERQSIPTMDILRRFKRRYGVTIDWIVEGDESGLSVQARKMLFDID